MNDARRRTSPYTARCLIVLAIGVATVGARAAELDVAIERYQQIIADELARGIVPCVSVAWVVDGRVMHAAGYGLADRERNIAATADTIYRAGSISKLFNALGAMRLVEEGKLDLDAPLSRALPEFQIQNPFPNAADVTVRQLLCHRSGMIRESPVGGYLDTGQPDLVATVASVAGCAIVNPPNTMMRYSNVGPTLVGRAVEVQSQIAYPDYQRRYILEPLGMSSSAWMMTDALRPRLAKAVMRVANGDGTYRTEAAPEFELGTVPAGNLYTTAADLARFAAYVIDAGSAVHIVKRETLESMFTVQLTNESTGFGLGFSVGKFRDHKTVQHTGAVYGFTSSLVVLPEQKIGAIVLTSADLAGAAVRRLSESALSLLLEAVKGESIPKVAPRVDISDEQLTAMAGNYESQSYWATLTVDNRTVHGAISGQEIELTPIGPGKFVADGRLMYRTPVDIEMGTDGRVVAFSAAGQRFQRVANDSETNIPAAWQGLLGMYGPKFIPLVVSARHGHLYATVENEYDYRLMPVNRVCFDLTPGMYADEKVVFQLSDDARASSVIFANQTLRRVGK